MINQMFANSAFFGIAVTFLAFFVAKYIQKKSRLEFLNPILISSAFIILFLYFTKIDFEHYSISADWISFLLKPATVALAIPLYKQISIVKKNLPTILIGTFIGSISSMISILLLSKLFSLPPELYRSLLPKSITTAIGVEISQEIGGIPAITAAIIIVTGTVGAALCSMLFRLFKITDPIAKGLALGTSSHAVGTSKALQLGEIEAAISSIAIVSSGIITVIVAPIFANLNL